jgi:hypothetical protein
MTDPITPAEVAMHAAQFGGVLRACAAENDEDTRLEYSGVHGKYTVVDDCPDRLAGLLLAAPAMADLIATQAAEIERLTTEAAGFGTVGTELGERLRGEVLSNCHGCGHDIPSYAPNMSACGVLVAGDTRPMKWLDSADCDKDGYPPKTATGCPAWKAKTDNNEKG